MNTSIIFAEKQCRLCSHTDIRNENIFHTSDRILAKKIAAVFSIWVTPTDPLPKCICSKCYGIVTTTYKSYSQVKKLQTKWLENVAKHERSNNYVKVLNFVEHAKMSIKNFIKTNYDERLYKDVIENLLISALSGMHENTARTVEAFNNGNNSNDTHEIQIFKREAPSSDDDDEENLSLAKIAKNKKMKLSPTLQESTEVECKYCPAKFKTLKQLAEHQISHLKLSIPKLFQPKCLDKNSRRGCIASMHPRESFRCLNCYLVFEDSKSITEHWSNAECDFYCQICNEEFANSPNLLREHIANIHGISYRSLKMQRDLSFLNMSPNQKVLLNTLKQKLHPKSKVSNTDVSIAETPLNRSTVGSIKCRICNRDFRNFNACNSHMRAHKVNYSYNDTEQLPDLNTDSPWKSQPMGYGDEPQASSNIAQKQATVQITSLAATTTENITYTCNENSITSETIKTEQIDMELDKLTVEIPTNSFVIRSTIESIVQDRSREYHSGQGLSTQGNMKQTTTTTPTYITNTNLENESIKPEQISNEFDTTTLQVNSSNNNTEGNVSNHTCSSSFKLNLPSSSPNTFKTTTSTVPRGIRVKINNRRRDLNSVNSAIKVKSINDLQATTPSLPTCVPKHASLNNLSPIQNIPACSPQLMPPNETSQTITTCSLPLVSIGNLNSIQCEPKFAPPPYHTSVIVNNTLQNPPYQLCNNLEPPTHRHNTFMQSSISDETMEFF